MQYSSISFAMPVFSDAPLLFVVGSEVTARVLHRRWPLYFIVQPWWMCTWGLYCCAGWSNNLLVQELEVRSCSGLRLTSVWPPFAQVLGVATLHSTKDCLRYSSIRISGVRIGLQDEFVLRPASASSLGHGGYLPARHGHIETLVAFASSKLWPVSKKTALNRAPNLLGEVRHFG